MKPFGIGFVEGLPALVLFPDDNGAGVYCRAQNADGSGTWTVVTPNTEFKGAIRTQIGIVFGVPWAVCGTNGHVFRAASTSGLTGTWSIVGSLWGGEAPMHTLHRLCCIRALPSGEAQVVSMHEDRLVVLYTSGAGTTYHTASYTLRGAEKCTNGCFTFVDVNALTFVFGVICTAMVALFQGGVTEHHTVVYRSVAVS